MICQGLPRERLAHLPSPLEAAPRLSAALGVEVLVKREDLTGLCAGGNKVRLLEFVMGELLAEGVDTLIASAAAQSNKLREVAAAAARCGLHAVLLLPDDGTRHPPAGNRLLFELLGAEIRHLAPGLDDAGVLAAQQGVEQELARAGRTPAVLDRRLEYGVQATLAYVDAAEELHRQLLARGRRAHAVFITAGAGMTVAGLALGMKHLGTGARITGVCVAQPAAALLPQVLWHAARAQQRLRLTTRLAEEDVVLVDEFLAPGYGVVTTGVRDAVQHVARHHGLVLDPVYNAKTALALIQQARRGTLPEGATVVLVNTGGAPGIHVHGADLVDGDRSG
jgi:D-cysteine desulfhydrase/L-cysteate sulfo-lyase